MKRHLFLALSLSLVAFAAPTFAQNGPDNGGGRGQGGGGDRPQWNPEEMQKRMMDRLKEQLKVPDEEWAVMQPKIEKVVTAQRDARVGAGGMGGGRGGANNGRNRDGGGEENQSEIAKASRDLRTVLQKDGASDEEVNTALKAFRDARTKSEEALKTARAELKEVLSPRQEATFVMLGMLE